MTLSKILFLCDDPNDLGGLQRVLATLAHQMRLEGTQVVVGSLLLRRQTGFLDPAVERVPLFREGALSRLIQRFRIGPLHLQGRRLLRLRKIAQARARAKLRHLVSDQRPDAVIVFDSLMAQLVTEAGITGTRVIIQYHNSYGSLAPTADFQRLRKASQRASAFLALTAEDARSFAEAGFARASFVSNPVPFYPDTLPAEREHHIVALGRYHHQKAFDHLIAAWARVPRKGDWHLHLYGEGPDRPLIEAAVQAGDVAGTVTVHPPTWDAEAVLHRSAIYALSSRFEGLPMVVVEAMACGIPLVSTRCGPGPEGLADGCGLMATIGDSQGFADQLQILMDDEPMRRRLGLVGREKAKSYRVAAILRCWEDIITASPPMG
jgi:glycosyltransferase involved in cell wall biosynthesis